MSDHPDDERLDESHAAITRAARGRQRTSIVEMSFVAGAAILITVSTGFGAWNTFELREHTAEIRRLSEQETEIRRIVLLGTECIVEQLAEHRSLNAIGHRANAADHGYSYPIAPENEPPVVPGVLEQVCKTFLATTTSTNPASR